MRSKPILFEEIMTKHNNGSLQHKMVCMIDSHVTRNMSEIERHSENNAIAIIMGMEVGSVMWMTHLGICYVTFDSCDQRVYTTFIAISLSLSYFHHCSPRSFSRHHTFVYSKQTFDLENLNTWNLCIRITFEHESENENKTKRKRMK